MKEEKIFTQCLGCMEKYEAYDTVCPFCGYVNGTPPEEMFHLEPGNILNNRYLVGRVLGSGGFGITYIGWDRILERKVAIKEYMPRDCAMRMTGREQITILSGERNRQFKDGLKSFKQEAGKLVSLQDLEGTVKVYDLFEENQTAYLVMEFLDGENMRELLKRKEAFSVEEALKMIAPVMSALKEIHKQQLIHRDISPDNIFITKDGKVKLLDFGSARYASLAKNNSISVIVKKGYAPPEQYQVYKDQGEWTDVYSLAATIYRMITGIVPEDAIDRMKEDSLKAPSELGIQISKNQENALMNCLNTKISSRTQSIGEFERQLYSQVPVPRIDNETGDPVPEEKPKSGGKWKFILAAVLVLCVGIAGYAAFPGNKKEDSSTGNEVVQKEEATANYKGLSVSEAKDQARKNGLEIVIKDTENSDSAEEGIILGQEPEAGEELKDDTILVVVSAGTKKTKMQDYIGRSEEKAVDMADKKEFRPSIAKEGVESNFIPGYIAMQSEDAGKNLPKGSAFTLTLSAGREDIDIGKERKMPSLVGKTISEALKTAEDQQFYIGVEKHEYNVKVKKGAVCAQSVKKDDKIKGGTEVYLTISDGPEQMKVPKVVGLSLSEAKAALEKQKLKYMITEAYNNEYSSEYGEGVVMEQGVKGGTTVDEGTKIDLIVSKGNEPGKKPEEPAAGSEEEKTEEEKTDAKKNDGDKSGKKDSDSEKDGSGDDSDEDDSDDVDFGDDTYYMP